MAIKRRRPISEIIDEYFTDLETWAEGVSAAFGERPSWNLRECSLEPLREMVVTPKEVLVTVDLPFTNKNGVKVKPVGNSFLEISAKLNKIVRLDDLGVTHRRGEFQRYHCQLRIPVPVNMKKMAVNYKKGMLEVHLPRKH
jgi:HSP20 family molecular chaperone IbpA